MPEHLLSDHRVLLSALPSVFLGWFRTQTHLGPSWSKKHSYIHNLCPGIIRITRAPLKEPSKPNSPVRDCWDSHEDYYGLRCYRVLGPMMGIVGAWWQATTGRGTYEDISMEPLPKP